MSIFSTLVGDLKLGIADIWGVIRSLGGGELKVYKRLGNEARSAALEELEGFLTKERRRRP